MEIIGNPTQVEIKKAAQSLKDGHLVAFPTETVYGLGADAINEKAVSRVYSVKARPTDHPLIVHISSTSQLDKWAIDIPKYAFKLAEEFWPGPMTLILKRTEIAKNFITGGQENVGVRVPSHPVALALLGEFEKLGGLGVAAPSANRFGKVSPTSSADVQEDLGKYLEEVDQILDGGRSLVGIESTIINCLSESPEVLRPGLITLEAITKVTGINVKIVGSIDEIKTPGALPAHYSPKAKVLTQGVAKQGEGFLALVNIKTPQGAIRLAAPLTVDQFAKQLYGALRLADQIGLSKVIVIPPEGIGLAMAIRDRLSKATGNSDLHQLF
jgi:L-threonylcarbamoyladenylate synthase